MSNSHTPNELVAPNAGDDAPKVGVVDPKADCVCTHDEAVKQQL